MNNHAGRVGVLFRYEDANNFAGIGYDVDGTWVWLNGSNNGKLPFTKVLEQGREYKLSVKYAGEYITVLIDDEKVYEGIVSGIKTTAGKIGLRNWGYPGNYSNATFDYFVNGEFSPVTNAKANSHLTVEGENDATITQTATGLVPGQSYSASVWVEVSDGRKVTLSVEKERQKIEVTIPVKGNIIRSEQVSNDMYVSIDLVEEVIERQLRKYKNKLVARNQGHPTSYAPSGNSFRKEFFDSEEETTEDDEVRIVRTKKFGIKPMFPEDACVQMELLGHNFFVFSNAETDEVNVVYKRKDGSFGLIEPEFS